MKYKIKYSEYMEYEEEVEATTETLAKSEFEDAVSSGQIEPVTAEVIKYEVTKSV